MQKTKRLNAFWCVRSLFFAYSKHTAFSDLRSLLFFGVKNAVFSRKCDPWSLQSSSSSSLSLSSPWLPSTSQTSSSSSSWQHLHSVIDGELVHLKDFAQLMVPTMHHTGVVGVIQLVLDDVVLHMMNYLENTNQNSPQVIKLSLEKYKQKHNFIKWKSHTKMEIWPMNNFKSLLENFSFLEKEGKGGKGSSITKRKRVYHHKSTRSSLSIIAFPASICYQQRRVGLRPTQGLNLGAIVCGGFPELPCQVFSPSTLISSLPTYIGLMVQPFKQKS